MNNKTRPKVQQLKMPAFLQDAPIDWAIRNQWRTTANKPGCARGARAHVSFAISACVAGVAALPYAEQQKLLLAGARSILERDAKSPAREQIRLYRSATIRPAGAARAI